MKSTFDPKSLFSGISQNLPPYPQINRFTEKETLADLILKTRVKVNMHLLGPPTQVSAVANNRGVPTLMHVQKNWRKERP